LNRFIKAAKHGCRPSRHSYSFGITRLERDRSLEGSIRSNPIEVDLLKFVRIEKKDAQKLCDRGPFKAVEGRNAMDEKRMMFQSVFPKY
jgi:hypothetical protein